MCSVAEAMQASMGRHMAEEEATMFPLLQRHLCPAEQRAMVGPRSPPTPTPTPTPVVPTPDFAADCASESQLSLVENLFTH